MSAGAVLRAASGGVTRRLVQTVVVFVLLAAASATGLLGLALVTNANESFFNGFAALHGADVAVSMDSGKVTGAQLAATAHVPEVTKAAGPYPEVTVSMAWEQPEGGPKGGPSGHGGAASSGRGVGRSAGGRSGETSLNVVGRASRGGPLDHLTLLRGHWLTGPGQIVLANYRGFGIPLGAKVTMPNSPCSPPPRWPSPPSVPWARRAGQPPPEPSPPCTRNNRSRRAITARDASECRPRP